MSDTATELTPAQSVIENNVVTDTQTEGIAIEAQPQGDGDPAPLHIEDDAAVDAALQQSTIPVPDGGELVDGKKAGEIARAYRVKMKELRGELESLKPTAAKAEQLEQQIQQLQGQLQQLQPYVTAYQQMTQAAQQAVTPEDESEAEEYAKLLDLYTTEGKPDIGRAKKAIALFDRRAKSYAEQTVAPLQQQSVSSASANNLARATNTVVGDVKADPDILKMVWSRLDPAVTATPEGAQHALVQAIGFTVLQRAGQAQTTTQRAPNGQFTKQEVAAPIFTEKAGGQASPATDTPLSAQEQAYIKQMGMSEKEYRDSARSAPWLRR